MSLKVLFIDSDDETRASLGRRLKRSDQIELVGALASAPAANEAGSKPDVVLVDLPESTGRDRDLCRAIRRAIHAPLVVLVSFMTEERWLGLREAGASGYLLRQAGSEGLAGDLVTLATGLDVSTIGPGPTGQTAL
jgi:DNA-binding NarL/FixJ family response regulator